MSGLSESVSILILNNFKALFSLKRFQLFTNKIILKVYY